MVQHARHSLLMTTLLIAYIGSLIATRTLVDDLERQNDLVQLVTALVYLVVAYILAYHGGGQQAWPAILPLVVTQSLLLIGFTVLKYAGLRNTVSKVDTFVSSLVAFMSSTTLLYTIIPQWERWWRHLEVLVLVCLGLPLAYAAPSLVARKAFQNDTPLIMKALEASDLVYTRGSSAGFKEVEFTHNKETGARCGVYIRLEEDVPTIYVPTIYVAFAGSDSKADWVRTNLSVKTQRFSECYPEKPFVHDGFLNAWKSIRDDVWKQVSDLILRYGGTAKIVMCGHSLGGGMATLAALDLACLLDDTQKKSLAVVTFGSPRVGDKQFQQLFNKTIPKSIRVAALYDPIPKIIINDFVHVHQQLTTTNTSHLIDSYKSGIHA